MCRARMDVGAEGGSPGSWEVAVSPSCRAGGLLPVTAWGLEEGRLCLNADHFSHPYFHFPPSFSFPFNSFLHLLCLSHCVLSFLPRSPFSAKNGRFLKTPRRFCQNGELSLCFSRLLSEQLMGPVARQTLKT